VIDKNYGVLLMGARKGEKLYYLKIRMNYGQILGISENQKSVK
jgi:hypothetical protein